MKTLISFLGRGPIATSGLRKDYRLSRYRFFDDQGKIVWDSQPAKHFAHAVFEYHRQFNESPFSKVVILGTSGSMWDALSESFGGTSGEALSGTVFELSEMVDKNSVVQSVLDRYAMELSRSNEVEIQLQLIPSAADKSGQSEILRRLNESVGQNDSVWLDVTHGYRHLPILGLAAAAISAMAANARVEEISYGAMEMSTGEYTPVISLKWILRLLQVLNASSSLSSYRQLRPLVECFPSGRLRNALDDAAYKLDVMRIDEAGIAVRECVSLLNQNLTQLPLELQIVSSLILDRLQQYGQLNRTIAGLTYLAERSLEADDFLRSAIFLAEAVDKAVATGIPGNEELDRKLKIVRNWLAHAGKLSATSDDRDVRDWVANRKKLREFMMIHINRLRLEMREASNSKSNDDK